MIVMGQIPDITCIELWTWIKLWLLWNCLYGTSELQKQKGGVVRGPEGPRGCKSEAKPVPVGTVLMRTLAEALCDPGT